MSTLKMAVFSIVRHFEIRFGNRINIAPVETDLLNVPIQFNFRQICDGRKGEHFQKGEKDLICQPIIKYLCIFVHR